MAVKKQDVSVTIYFVQKTGLVIVAKTLFPAPTSPMKIAARIKEFIKDQALATGCLDFLSTYQDVAETVSVIFFCGGLTVQFNYQREELPHD